GRSCRKLGRKIDALLPGRASRQVAGSAMSDLNAASVIVSIAALLTYPLDACAQLNVLISGGFSGPYEQLLPEFERTTGIKVSTGYGSSQGTGPQTIAAQLAAGAATDVVILSREGLMELNAAGR